MTAAACHDAANKATSSSTAALVPLAQCSDALDAIRADALGKMEATLDEHLKTALQENFCRPSYPEAGAPSSGGNAGGATSSNGAVDDASSGPTHATGTNDQVAGVDEADTVKNDGKYIYLVEGQTFRILKSWPAASTSQVARVDLAGVGRKLFVDGDRALVYVSMPQTVPDPAANQTARGGPNGVVSGAPYNPGRQECTYGYDCDFTGDGTATKILVYDISDRATPKELRTIDLSGSLIAARRIGHAVHTVVSDTFDAFPELNTWPEWKELCTGNGQAQSETWIRNAFAALREKNRQLIADKPLDVALPHIADTADPNANASMCSALYRSSLRDGTGFTTLASVDIQTVAPIKATTIMSRPGAVYAGSDALYLAVPDEPQYCDGWYEGFADVKQVSAIHKFQIGAKVDTTTYAGSGLVKGRVLNQFSLDDRQGILRIATTSGRVPDPAVESQLTVLSPGGSGLVQTGIVEHIAPHEDIRSVRFDGDRAFVVTFKKTDPLYVIDLKDAQAPKILGELKIPGFSTYMHMLDDTHLLSIGLDANDHDSFAFFDGVLLQIFDVSNPTDPRQAARYKIGTRGSASAALTDHLAFNYDPVLKMLAVPMTICEGGGDGTFGDQLTFSGLIVFDVDAQSGIAEHGRVAHGTQQLKDGASCSQWWSNATSVVKRSIFMDRFVYSIAADVVQVQTVDELGADVASVSLAP